MYFLLNIFSHVQNEDQLPQDIENKSEFKIVSFNFNKELVSLFPLKYKIAEYWFCLQ